MRPTIGPHGPGSWSCLIPEEAGPRLPGPRGSAAGRHCVARRVAHRHRREGGGVDVRSADWSEAVRVDRGRSSSQSVTGGPGGQASGLGPTSIPSKVGMGWNMEGRLDGTENGLWKGVGCERFDSSFIGLNEGEVNWSRLLVVWCTVLRRTPETPLVCILDLLFFCFEALAAARIGGPCKLTNDCSSVPKT